MTAAVTAATRVPVAVDVDYAAIAADADRLRGRLVGVLVEAFAPRAQPGTASRSASPSLALRRRVRRPLLVLVAATDQAGHRWAGSVVIDGADAVPAGRPAAARRSSAC